MTVELQFNIFLSSPFSSLILRSIAIAGVIADGTTAAIPPSIENSNKTRRHWVRVKRNSREYCMLQAHHRCSSHIFIPSCHRINHPKSPKSILLLYTQHIYPLLWPSRFPFWSLLTLPKPRSACFYTSNPNTYTIRHQLTPALTHP